MPDTLTPEEFQRMVRDEANEDYEESDDFLVRKVNDEQTLNDEK